MAKEITIIASHHGRDTKYTGTIEHLRTQVFGYTLECGNSWNHKIPVAPKNSKVVSKGTQRLSIRVP